MKALGAAKAIEAMASLLESDPAHYDINVASTGVEISPTIQGGGDFTGVNVGGGSNVNVDISRQAATNAQSQHIDEIVHHMRVAANELESHQPDRDRVNEVGEHLKGVAAPAVCYGLVAQLLAMVLATG